MLHPLFNINAFDCQYLQQCMSIPIQNLSNRERERVCVYVRVQWEEGARVRMYKKLIVFGGEIE